MNSVDVTYLAHTTYLRTRLSASLQPGSEVYDVDVTKSDNLYLPM